MFTSVYVLPKINSEQDYSVQAVVRMITTVAASHNVDIVVTRTSITPTTLIWAVGGDGTMLEAMRLSALTGATAIGVNLGNVGFLTELNPDMITPELIADIITSQAPLTIEHRTALTGAATDPKILSCNEVSIAPMSSDTMIKYKLKVDGYDAGMHRANSILISTSTGSTAYALSAGGALMMPSVDSIQLVPVAPMTMTSRPIIVPASSVITVEAIGHGISVRSDGQVVNGQPQPATESNPFKLQIKKFERPVNVAHTNGWNFFTILSQKFGWNHR